MNNPEKASEPTMEEILSSIRRIIADDEDDIIEAASQIAADDVKPKKENETAEEDINDELSAAAEESVEDGSAAEVVVEDLANDISIEEIMEGAEVEKVAEETVEEDSQDGEDVLELNAADIVGDDLDTEIFASDDDISEDDVDELLGINEEDGDDDLAAAEAILSEDGPEDDMEDSVDDDMSIDDIMNAAIEVMGGENKVDDVIQEDGEMEKNLPAGEIEEQDFDSDLEAFAIDEEAELEESKLEDAELESGKTPGEEFFESGYAEFMGNGRDGVHDGDDIIQTVDAYNGLLSNEAVASTSAAFGKLAETVLLDAGEAKTLEDLVKEMVRPLLKGWLDSNLPPLVERLVKEEIEKISSGHRR